MLSPGLVLALLLLGCLSGFMAGLLGVGGGLILVPFLSLLFAHQGVAADVNLKLSIATSLATICFTSLSSARAHHRLGRVRWDITRVLVPGILVGSWLGAQLASQLKGPMLALVFTLFIGYSAVQMWRDRKPKPGRELPGKVALFGVALVIGLLSGLLGAGGGFLSVPFMVWCNVPIHVAVATSASLGFPIALAGSLGYIYAGWGHADLPAWSLGYVQLGALAAIVATSVLFAPLGARTAQRMQTRPLRRSFAVVLVFLALSMLRQVFGAA